jgi:CheY-like chemotaxis protein
MTKLKNNNEIVMVDDDTMELRLFERFVAKSNLTNAVLTFDGAERFMSYLDDVEQDTRQMPSLVLIDVRMPGTDGFELVTGIRKKPKFKTTPILMMFSNSDEASDIRRAEAAGANGYRVKPSNGEEYVEFLNSLI